MELQVAGLVPEEEELNGEKEVTPIEVTLYDLSFHYHYFMANPDVKWVLKDPQMPGTFSKEDLEDRAQREEEFLTQRAKQMFAFRQHSMQADSSSDNESDDEDDNEMEEMEASNICTSEKRSRSNESEEEESGNVKRVCLENTEKFEEIFIAK